MTTTEDRKSPQTGKRWTLQIVVVVILLLIARFLWMRTQPEFMADTAGIAESDVLSGDYLYRLQNNINGSVFSQPVAEQHHQEVALYAVPLQRGGTHKISQEDARRQFADTQFGFHPLQGGQPQDAGNCRMG